MRVSATNTRTAKREKVGESRGREKKRKKADIRNLRRTGSHEFARQAKGELELES
jgi:hypothetical protein